MSILSFSKGCGIVHGKCGTNSTSHPWVGDGRSITTKAMRGEKGVTRLFYRATPGQGGESRHERQMMRSSQPADIKTIYYRKDCFRLDPLSVSYSHTLPGSKPSNPHYLTGNPFVPTDRADFVRSCNQNPFRRYAGHCRCPWQSQKDQR